MLFRLTATNCAKSGTRSIFVILAVVLALTVNGLYLSYASRVEARAKLQPGAPRILVLVPKVAGEEVLEMAGLSPSVMACERIVGREMLVGAHILDLWTYPTDTAIVKPLLIAGRAPEPGEMVMQQELAELIGAEAGSELVVSDPADRGGVRPINVAGVFCDPLWPAMLSPVEDRSGSDGSELLLVSVKPETDVIGWQRWFSAMGGGSAVPLEDMNWSVGRALTAYADRANDVLRQPSSQADRLKLNLATLILVLAALGVANGVALSMVDHEAETALLRSIGASAGTILLMRLGEATVLMGLGVGVAAGGASLATWLVPDLVGTAFVQCVLQGSLTVVIVSLCATLVLVGLWHTGSPMMLLRRRAS